MNHQWGQTFLPLKAHTQSLLISALQPCSSPLPGWCVAGATAKLCNSAGSTDKFQCLSSRRRAQGQQTMAGLGSNRWPITLAWLLLLATTFSVAFVCKFYTRSRVSLLYCLCTDLWSERMEQQAFHGLMHFQINNVTVVTQTTDYKSNKAAGGNYPASYN